MADCVNCCVAGLTPTPSVADPCVANAGKGAIFVGSTGLIYIRKTITVPATAADWVLLSAAAGGTAVTVISPGPIVGAASAALSGGTTAVPIAYTGQVVSFTITNPPSSVKTMYLFLVSTGWAQLAGLGGNSNVDMRHYINFNSVSGFMNKEQSVGIPSQDSRSITTSRVATILPNTSLAVQLINYYLVYGGTAPYIAGQRIQYSYQITSIG